ncbi:MAG: hypothetical protein KDD29_06010 [Flavobacteriales bacterium]|nr:hypothetical protein [Flavobacteriales bacterium]MCB9336273.1 hypothetical protein [Flavobacteriales bacterium]
MKSYKKLILATAIALTPILSFGQYCNYFHENFCEPAENEMYKPNGQSKSALFGKGQTSELSVIVYKGQDYRISLCMDENLGSGLEFKVYESKKVKVEKVYEKKEMEDVYAKCESCGGTGTMDGDNCWDCNGSGQVATGDQKEVITKETKMVEERQKILLYDNTQDNMATELEFTCETTQRLIFEISVPDGGGSGSSKGISKGKGKLMKSSDMGCIGILIEHMTTPITGFYGTGF